MEVTLRLLRSCSRRCRVAASARKAATWTGSADLATRSARSFCRAPMHDFCRCATSASWLRAASFSCSVCQMLSNTIPRGRERVCICACKLEVQSEMMLPCTEWCHTFICRLFCSFATLPQVMNIGTGEYEHLCAPLLCF